MVYTTHKHAKIGDGGSYCFTTIRLVVISDASDSKFNPQKITWFHLSVDGGLSVTLS